MTFAALEECEGKIKQRRDTLARVFDEAGDTIDFSKVKTFTGTNAEKMAEVQKFQDELNDLGKEHDTLKQVQLAAQQVKQSRERGDDGPGERGDDDRHGKSGRRTEHKTLGELFVESDAYKLKKGRNEGPEVTLDVEVKTLFERGAGWAPEVTRTGRLVEFATRPVQVVDLIPSTTTGQSAIKYMEETLYTNAAAETAEGGTYPEAALGLEEKTSPVEKITVWLPMTDEQLEDVPQARGYLNNRLPRMIMQRFDSQIVIGNGASPNLRGMLNVAGIQTQAKGADPIPDAVFKGMVKVMTTGQAFPNAYITNPLDWQDIRLLRTADGMYIWGNPADAGPERIWGLQVAMAQVMTENTGVVLDTSFTEISIRRGINLKVSDSHSDFFVKGKQAVRADMRAAFVVYRPAAICSITGI